MFTLLESVGLRELLKRELFPFAVAFAIAELFYKLHSFALECLAFLATWYVLSLLQKQILGSRHK